MKKSSQSKPAWISKFVFVFLVISYLLLNINLGRDALFDWDEGIYASLGSEMIESQKIFVPTWNNEVWFEKPPGIAWTSALGQTLAGQSEIGSRLLQPVFSVAVLYLVFLLGSELISWRGGLISMGLLAGFNLFLGRTRAVNTDMPLLLGIAVTSYFLLKDKKPFLIALVVAASVWFKGLAGLLPLLIALPLIIGKSKSYISSILLYLVVLILPWHLYAYWLYGDTFLRPYLLEQVVTRITTPIEFHLESRWFYFQYLLENLGLGVIFAAGLGILFNFRDFLSSRKISLLFLTWWLLLPLVIFTVSKTRLFWYILPVYPAVALLIATAMEQISLNRAARRALAVISILICANGLVSITRSVEPNKTQVDRPDRLVVASDLNRFSSSELAVLVPPTERTAEAILPSNQRISSSFRYGGMPSVAYYYHRHVRFFYNVDEFNYYWVSADSPIAMVHRDDLALITFSYSIVSEEGEYLGIQKGLYAQR